MITAQTADGYSLLHLATTAAFAFHISAGSLALLSGTVAVFSPKGGRIHRVSGAVFFVSMVVMAVFAAFLAVVRPGQIANLFGALFTFYLVATSWMTVWRAAGAIGIQERIGLSFAAFLCVPLAVLVFQSASGLTLFFRSPRLEGPLLIATCSLAALVVLATATDAKVVLAGGIAGAPRVARHLWRMCLALSFAAGSAFTNGLPRLFPGPMNMSPFLFLPLFVPLGLMIFWLIRVRFTGWFKQLTIAEPG